MNRELFKAASELKNHPNIIVRRADKSNSFVVMDRDSYKAKLDLVLSDASKFTKLTKNPITDLKIKANRLIKLANNNMTPKILQPIVGEFKPGYIYGTIKTQKTGYPVRPIISLFRLPSTALQKNLTN